MTVLSIESAASIIAYPQDGTTLCNREGKARTWKGDEFICVSAVDIDQHLLIKGTQHFQRYCFNLDQITHIIATDTPHNRELLANFQFGRTEWIARPCPKILSRQLTRKSCKKYALQPHFSHVDAKGWALNPNTGVRQLVAS